MKIINYLFLVGAVVLFFVGLYFWLAKSQFDMAAFFFSLAAVGQSTFLMATKSDKPSS
jgi:hypothetical protein